MSDVVIAHHLPDGIAKQLAAGLPPGVTLVRTPQDDSWRIPADATAMICLPPHAGVYFPKDAPDGWPFGLRWVQTVSTGIDDYPRWVFDVAHATCGRGTQSAAIAEYAVASILALEKNFPEVWIDNPDPWYPMQQKPIGTVEGKTIGIIGYGTIGKGVAKRLLPFDAKILVNRRSGPGSDGDVEFAALDDVLARADHLVLAAPLTPETHHLIRRETLAKMKPDAHLVNVARGGMVDQDALLEALDAGRVRFATLDVTEPEPLPKDHPFYTHPRVHVTPHVSWGKGGNPFDAIGALIIENVARFRDGRDLLSPIDRNAGY